MWNIYWTVICSGGNLRVSIAPEWCVHCFFNNFERSSLGFIIIVADKIRIFGWDDKFSKFGCINLSSNLCTHNRSSLLSILWFLSCGCHDLLFCFSVHIYWEPNYPICHPCNSLNELIKLHLHMPIPCQLLHKGHHRYIIAYTHITRSHSSIIHDLSICYHQNKLFRTAEWWTTWEHIFLWKLWIDETEVCFISG